MQEDTAPAGAEGDVNSSPNRATWAADYIEPEARALLDRDEAAFLHQSVSTPCLSVIKKAEGIWIEDASGRRYMDFHGNNVHHIGYGHPRLIEAVTKQMADLPFAPRRFTCEPAVTLAEKLGAITPGDLSKVLFATGGSDAVEIALKIARMKTGRFKTLSFWDAFHGAGFGASSVGGEEMFRGGRHGPLLPGTEHVPPFGDYRNAWGVREGSAEICANQIRYILEKEGDIGAFIAEPTRAVPYIPDPGFWQAVRQACDDHGTLLIFDEIPTGLGKTGRMFSCEYEGVVPDILLLGKALGGGMLPISAVVAKPELDVTGDYAIGHYTHEKNPVTTRAALTTIEIIEEEGLVEHAAELGGYALERLREMRQRHALIGDVRGRGFLFGVELVMDRDSRAPAGEAADQVLYAALAKGLSFKTTMGNVLTFTPSLVTSQSEMDLALDIIEASLGEVGQRLGFH
ncbi:4-aminobutyrate aminotransferase [Aestuariispira insulae]|uniref:4-aminobutyrate aminotransferase n=2 Tax=Aestuariispira insulae TaxID=1461337 RepID=A0A3D9HSR5_9PROT|nr:4-aminobutyrate aminotransferase [Aestuariispira insulae]